MRIAILVVLALLLAGCGDKEPSAVKLPEGPSASDGSNKGADQLHGWIVDNAIVPVAGAVISIHGENTTATTDSEGYYGFNGLDTDRLMTMQVEAEGFKPQSKALTLLVNTLTQANFTLAPVPLEVATNEVISFTAHIECAVLIRNEDQRYPYECSAAGAVDNRVWEFGVQDNVAGIVVEAFWDYKTELASHLNLTVETMDLGIYDEILAQEEGPSSLRAQITQEQSNRFYKQGGLVRATIDIGRNIEEEEMAAGGGVAIDQEVQIIATIFYVAPPPPGYTVDS